MPTGIDNVDAQNNEVLTNPRGSTGPDVEVSDGQAPFSRDDGSTLQPGSSRSIRRARRPTRRTSSNGRAPRTCLSSTQQRGRAGSPSIFWTSVQPARECPCLLYWSRDASGLRKTMPRLLFPSFAHCEPDNLYRHDRPKDQPILHVSTLHRHRRAPPGPSDGRRAGRHCAPRVHSSHQWPVGLVGLYNALPSRTCAQAESSR